MTYFQKWVDINSTIHLNIIKSTPRPFKLPNKHQLASIKHGKLFYISPIHYFGRLLFYQQKLSSGFMPAIKTNRKSIFYC